MDELRVIREYLEDIPIIKERLTHVEEDVAELKADVKVIKSVLLDHNTQLGDHEHRICRLERQPQPAAGV